MFDPNQFEEELTFNCVYLRLFSTFTLWNIVIEYESVLCFETIGPTECFQNRYLLRSSDQWWKICDFVVSSQNYNERAEFTKEYYHQDSVDIRLINTTDHVDT